MIQSTGNVIVTVDNFDLAKERARTGLDAAVRAIAHTIAARAKQNIVQQDAVDTGALLNCVYVQDSQSDERPAAIEAARSAATSPGKKSGKTHEAPVASEGSRKGGKLVAKIGVPMEYAPYIELGAGGSNERPFLLPAANSVKGTVAGRIAAEMVAAALAGK